MSVTTEGAAVERIGGDGTVIAYIVRADFAPPATTFVTHPTESQQVGYVVYPAGGTIARHRHRPLERHILGTSEVLVVRRGRCAVDLFDATGRWVATRELCSGDVLVLVGGGHGFRMIEDTVLLEVKQGPYTGLSEKEFI